MKLHEDILLTTKEVARLTNMSEAYFEQSRVRGGPDTLPYLHIGRSVRYQPAEVTKWLAARGRTNTSGGA